ncbi:MAG: thiol-disulfide oxidoreductase DCC family protein [Breznakibacter sp.]
MENKKRGGYIIYDDHCKLCQRSVALLKQADKNHHFTFLPFSQAEAKEKLDAFHLDNSCLEEVVVIKGNTLHQGADGILEALQSLPLPWRLAAYPARLIPSTLRQRIYLWVARHRKRL